MKLVPYEEKEVSKRFECYYEDLSNEQRAATLAAAIEYEKLNQTEKLLKVRRDKVFRPIIESATDLYGVEDDNGHYHLIMEDKDQNAEVIRMKKISRTLNSVAAEELLKEKGLYDSCVMQVITWELDEEKIIEAYQAGLISAGELDKIFSEKITWATTVKTDSEEIEKIADIRKKIESYEGTWKEMPEIESS